MATISKIRKHSGWVIASIGIAMLGFLVSDVFTSGRFGLVNKGPKGIASVYGEEIEPKEFQTKLESAIQSYRSRMPADQNISAAQEAQVNDQVWNEYLNEVILKKELDHLGLNVGGEEIMDLVVGPMPHPIAMQTLMDPQTRKYDKEGLYKFMTHIDQAAPQQQKSWMDFENYLTIEREKEKYSNLVKGGMFVTDLEAKDVFLGQNKVANVNYVPYFTSAISDKDVEVTDADIQDYINKHKDQFKQEEARSIEYVSFDIAPTSKDSADAKTWIDEQAKAFQKVKNDSNFVSRRGTYPATWQHRGDLPAKMEDQIFSADTGTVIGPLFENGKYQIYKVSKIKTDSIFTYKASHILVRPGGPKEEDSVAADKKAREIYNQVKAGGDFAKIAAEKSQDPSNAGKGGDLGWFPASRMVPRFSNAVKKGRLGDLIIVRTEFGTHLIKITANPSNKAVKVALLEKTIQPSSETERAVYTVASNFRSKIQTPQAFDKQVTAAGLTKRLAKDIKHNDKAIRGLDNPRELIRWVYENEVGSISVPIPIGNKYVVAYFGKTKKEGLQNIEDARDQVGPLVRVEKKKEKLIEKMRTALESNKSLEAVAKAVGSTVNNAENVSFLNTPIPNIANEPAVIGYICGTKPNRISVPIKGEAGVFVVEVKSFNTITPPANFKQEREQQMRVEQSRAAGDATNALHDAADPKDYRYLYF